MKKEIKTYTVTRIENGFVEATSLKKAKRKAETDGFTVGYSSEHVNKETSANNKFWANMDVDKLKQLKLYFDLLKPVPSGTETINGRPNLSLLTRYSNLKNVELDKQEDAEFKKVLSNAIINIPGLICIAEAFHDMVKGENPEGMNYMLVSDLLNNIKNADYGDKV